MATVTTLPIYPAIPPGPTRAPGATAQAHGGEVLKFILSTDTTATLSDADLELADMAAMRAAAALPKELRSTDHQLAQQLTQTRHRIARALVHRRSFAQEVDRAIEAFPTNSQRTPPNDPSRLQPPPPVQPGPPGGIHADDLSNADLDQLVAEVETLQAIHAAAAGQGGGPPRRRF